jgi:hypothetical protein
MIGKTSSRKLFLIALSAIGWLAIILQFYLLITNRKLSIVSTIVQFFSYFTILTNIVVATYSSILLSASTPKKIEWFISPRSATALTVYIVIVGFVYNAILRFLWNPIGLQKVVDEALHLIIPLLFLLYWFLFVPKESLKWKNIFPWLLYPVIYLAYILIRGSITNLYPYPFLEINNIGTAKVFTNILVLCIAFLGVSLLFTGIGKLTSSGRRQ